MNAHPRFPAANLTGEEAALRWLEAELARRIDEDVADRTVFSRSIHKDGFTRFVLLYRGELYECHTTRMRDMLVSGETNPIAEELEVYVEEDEL